MKIRTLIAAALLAVCTLPTSAATLGPEMVQDSSFDTGTPWSLGYGWQVLPAPGGLAYHNEGASSAIFQPATTLTSGATYRLVYTVTNTATSSDPRHWFRIGGSPVTNTPIAYGAGTFTFDVVIPSSPSSFGVVAVYGCACVISDVSLRAVLP